MKRKTKKQIAVGDPYQILRTRVHGEPVAVYLCLGCSRAWQLKEPTENWRIKVLLNHAATHRVDTAIDEAVAKLSSTPLKLDFPKKPRRKRKKAEQKTLE